MFKVGDRVFYSGDFTEELIGQRGTVIAIRETEEVMVDWDDPSVLYCSGVMNSNLSLIGPSPMQIVNDYHENKAPPDPFKEQVGGSHYKTLKIQPVEFILANQLGFCEGSIIKYTCRYRQKGGIEDLKKVIHYAQLLIAKLEENDNA